MYWSDVDVEDTVVIGGAREYLSLSGSSRKNGSRTVFAPYTFLRVRPWTCRRCETKFGPEESV